VDEKSAGRGQDYVTIVSDLDKGTVCHIAYERRQASLDSFFDTLSPEHLAGIEAVAMDMWEPFANSVRAHLADADDKIVFDRFHLMGYLGEAVDTVRKQENRALMAEGDKSGACLRRDQRQTPPSLPLFPHSSRLDPPRRHVYDARGLLLQRLLPQDSR
jgi:transposase